MSKKVLHIETQVPISVPREVVKWNYRDVEHLDVVHGGYGGSKILYERSGLSVGTSPLQLPLIPFLRFQATSITDQSDEFVQLNFTRVLGTWIRTEIDYSESDASSTVVKSRYDVCLPRILWPLRGLIRSLVLRWNNQVWNEDLPVRIRRNLVLSWGFEDFRGLPHQLEKRVPRIIKDMTLPHQRVVDSPVQSHELYRRIRSSTPNGC